MAVAELRIEQRPGRVYTTAQEFRLPKATSEDAGFDATALANAAQLAADSKSDSPDVVRALRDELAAWEKDACAGDQLT